MLGASTCPGNLTDCETCDKTFKSSIFSLFLQLFFLLNFTFYNIFLILTFYISHVLQFYFFSFLVREARRLGDQPSEYISSHLLRHSLTPAPKTN